MKQATIKQRGVRHVETGAPRVFIIVRPDPQKPACAPVSTAPVKPVAVHPPQAHRQVVAPATTGVFSTRVQQLQLQAPHVRLGGVNLRDHQLALVLRCELRQVEPVEAALDRADGLQLAVSRGPHLVVCGAKGAQVQAAQAAAQNTRRQQVL